MIYLGIILGIILVGFIIYNEIMLCKATKSAIEKMINDILKNYRRK